MISSILPSQNMSLSSSNFIANEISSLQSSFLRLSSDFYVIGSNMDNLEKAYADAIEKLSGMMKMQVQMQRKSDKLLHLPKEDTSTTGQSQNFHNISVDSDKHTSYYYDAGNGNLEAFIYEEEDCFLNSNYENRLTTEEFFFAASILDPTFSGICLPSAFPDSFDFEISMESNLPISNGPAVVHHYRLPPQGISISSKTSANTSNRSLLHKFIFSNRVSVQIFNQYRVILWDPGIFYFL
jgi:hypothetical protein